MSHSNMNKQNQQQQRPSSSSKQNIQNRKQQPQQYYDTNEAPATAYQQDEQHYQIGSDPFVMRVRQQIQKSLHQQQQQQQVQNYYTPIERESPQTMFDNSVDERPNIQTTPQEQELERRTMNQVNSQTQLNDNNMNNNNKKGGNNNRSNNNNYIGGGQKIGGQQEKQLNRDSSRTKTVDLSNAQPYQTLNTLQESPSDSIGDKSNYQKYQQYQQMIQSYQEQQQKQQQEQEEDDDDDEEEQELEDQVVEEDDNLLEDNYEQEGVFEYNETEEQKRESSSPDQQQQEDDEIEHNFVNNTNDNMTTDPDNIQQQQQQQQQYQLDDMDPYQYQQIVEELIQENDQLRSELQIQSKKLEKVENQLQKTKTMLREVGTIRDDIMHLKQTAEEADDIDSVVAENEILKAKIGDLETKVSSLSKDEDDLLEMRSREKMQYENKIKDLKDENYRFSERFRQANEEMERFVFSLDQANKIIEIRDKMVKELETNYKLLQDEHIKIIKENQNISSQLKDSRFQDSQFDGVDNSNNRLQQYTGPASGRSNPYAYQGGDHLSNQSNKQYIALRNRSSEKNNQGLSQNSQFKRQLSASDNNIINDCDVTDLPYNNERRQSQIPQQIIHGQSEYQPHSFTLDESTYIHHNQQQMMTSDQLLSNNKYHNKERLSPDRENRNIYSNLDNQRQNKQGDNEQQQQQQQLYRDTTPLKQPVQITISSPTKQNTALVERCQKLEQYCRELVRTNKILDCENRLAIAQLIHLTDGGQQLSNLVSALNIVATSGKIYDNNNTTINNNNNNNSRRLNSSGQVTTTSAANGQKIKLNQSDIRRANTGGFNTLNISKIGTRRQSLQPNNGNNYNTVSQRSGSKSLKNLITLRSGGGAATIGGLNISGINNNNTIGGGGVKSVGYMTQIPSNLIAQSLINQNYNVQQNNRDGAQSIKINLRGGNNNNSSCSGNKQNQSLVIIKKSNLNNIDLPLQRDQERNSNYNNQTLKQVRGVHPNNNNTTTAAITDINKQNQLSDNRQQNNLIQRGKMSERGIQEAKELEITQLLFNQKMRELENQIQESNINLHFRKVSDFYYSIGENGHIVNLRLNLKNKNILIKSSEKKNSSQQPNSPQFQDFIEYLANKGYLQPTSESQ